MVEVRHSLIRFLTPWRGRGSVAVRTAVGFTSLYGHFEADLAVETLPHDISPWCSPQQSSAFENLSSLA